MSTRLEDAVRRLLDDAAPEPPDGSAPAVFAPQHRTARWLPLAAVGVVLLVVIGLLVGRAHRESDPTVGSKPVAPTPTVTAPAGMKLVGYYGISIQVPASWPVKPIACGFYPHHDSVSPETGVSYPCPARTGPAAPPDPAHTTVTLLSAALVDLVSTRPRSVDGVPALVTTHNSGGTSSGTLVLESRQVAIQVFAPTAAKVRAILGTVHIARTDARGCVDRAQVLNDATGGKAGDGASALVPGVPTSAVVCQYDIADRTYRLVGSRELSASQTARLRQRLNSGTTASHVQGPAPARVRYRFVYADGSAHTVEATLDLDPAEVTDGSRTVNVPYGNGGLPGAFG